MFFRAPPQDLVSSICSWPVTTAPSSFVDERTKGASDEGSFADFSGRWLVSNRVLASEEESSTFRERALALGIYRNHIVKMVDAESFRRELSQAAGAGQNVLDVRDSPVVPGFVNAHTHLALSPLRGATSRLARENNVVEDLFFRVERHLTREDVRAFTRVGALEALRFGVLEVWDHYYFGDAVAEALLEVGLPGVVAPTLQDLSGPFSEHSDAALSATEEISRSSRFERAGILAALGPHATDTVSEDLFRRAVLLSEKLSLPLHMHLAQSISEVRAHHQAGDDSFSSRLKRRVNGRPLLFAHGLFLTAEDCRALAESGATMAYTPYSQLQFGILGPLRAWLSAGGNWAVGTDAVASNDSLDVQRELPLVGGEAALEGSFSPERARLLTSLDAAEETEAERRNLLQEIHVADADRLLLGAVGPALQSLGLNTARGIALGAPARLLILDSEHPVLFPGTDLARAHAYSPTVAAIEQMIVGDHLLRPGEGIFSPSESGEILKEAKERRLALLRRAQMTEVL